MAKSALVTGITGQDGSYLAELLLHKGYIVHGVIRRASTFNTGRLDSIYQDPHVKDTKMFLHYGDLTDSTSVHRLIDMLRPDEIYHLGAQSHVRVSFDIPEYTADATGLGTTRLLEAMRDICPRSRFYQAGSSEMFGKVQETPQRETTPFYPRSPYGAAKVYAHWMAVNYREAYGLHVSNGILFNHESPRRGETFVTRKITRWIADHLDHKSKEPLYLGNLSAKRDWGYAPEYVVAMWRMLQQPEPDDYVIATGETHSVADFVREAFSYAKIEEGEHIKIDENYYRPTEVDILLGDADKAERKLGWKPRVTFSELVRIMVEVDAFHATENLKAVWDKA
jgi:GDPmannose 4,6-dehydratase